MTCIPLPLQALEERLKARSQTLSTLPVAPRPSVFVSKEDMLLLEPKAATSAAAQAAAALFPSAVDRHPGHTRHAYSPAGQNRPALPGPLTLEPAPQGSPGGARDSIDAVAIARGGSSRSPSRQAQPRSPPKRAQPGALVAEIVAAAAAAAGPHARALAAASAAAEPSGALALVAPRPKGTGSRNSTRVFGPAVVPAPATGQRKYDQLLQAAQGSRALVMSKFQKEMDGIDLEIMQYVSEFKCELFLPDAATTIQAAYRSRGPRLLFNRLVSPDFDAPLRSLSRGLQRLRM